MWGLLTAHLLQLGIRLRFVSQAGLLPGGCPSPRTVKAGPDVVSGPEQCGQLADAPASPLQVGPLWPALAPHSFLQPPAHQSPPPQELPLPWYKYAGVGGEWLWRLLTPLRPRALGPGQVATKGLSSRARSCRSSSALF